MRAHLASVTLTYRKVISHGPSRRQRTLGPHDSTIHKIGTDLINAMPMEAKSLVSQTIGYMDDDAVTLGGLESWAGPMSINANDRSLVSVWRSLNPANVPCVFYNSPLDSHKQPEVRSQQDLIHDFSRRERECEEGRGG